jgi:hypothetical protein
MSTTPEDASDFEAMVILRLNALQYWLTELYALSAGNQPGRMAALFAQKLDSLKREPPMGPATMSPAELDQVMLAELPMILHVGGEMRLHLEAMQELMDAGRREHGQPRPPIMMD